jgi:hypothetical protein
LRWTYVGANPRPAKGVYVGRDGVRKFLERIRRNLNMTTYHPREFVTENDAVVVIGYEAGTSEGHRQTVSKRMGTKVCRPRGLITEMAEYDMQVDTTP